MKTLVSAATFVMGSLFVMLMSLVETGAYAHAGHTTETIDAVSPPSNRNALETVEQAKPLKRSGIVLMDQSHPHTMLRAPLQPTKVIPKTMWPPLQCATSPKQCLHK